MTHDRNEALDDLFAQARALNVTDEVAGERAVRAFRRTRRHAVRARLIVAVTSAAALGAILVAQHEPALPASAAYEVYRHASGGGW